MSTKKGTKFTKAHRLALSKAATARYAKKEKKRGRKPGVKVEPYKKNKSITLDEYTTKILKPMTDKFMAETQPKNYSPAPMVLCGQLEDAILLLENRISNAIAKINSLM